MNVELWLLLLICLSILPAYYKAVSFTSKNGVLLLILGFLAFLLRILLLEKYPLLATVNKETLPLSISFMLVPSVLFIIFSFLKKGDVLRKRQDYLIKLLLSYLLFGALQQLFFLSVFTDLVYYLTLNYKITFLISVVFFFIFHLNFGKELTKFLPCLVGFGIISVFIYLRLGNIVPQILIHGVVGSILYTAFSTQDQLKKRLS